MLLLAGMSEDRAWAVVTGASSGIGRALAQCFARDRHPVALVARSQDKLHSLASELGAIGAPRTRVLVHDLTEREAPARVVRAMADVEIEALVNNAGFGSNGLFWELPLERELEMVDLNIRALVELSHRFLPRLRARGRGYILNIGSVAGFQAGPLMSTYYASKAFVQSFSEGLALELQGSSVSVTVHCPGATASDFAQTAGNDVSRLFESGRVASSEAVAADAYRAMRARKVSAIHGLTNRIMAWSGRLVPRTLAASVSKRLNERPD